MNNHHDILATCDHGGVLENQGKAGGLWGGSMGEGSMRLRDAIAQELTLTNTYQRVW